MIKKVIKKIIGQGNITFTKQQVKFLQDKVYLLSHPNIYTEIKDLSYLKYSQPGKNIFFGYYDISQFDKAEERLLVHVVKKDADTKTDKAELGYYFFESGEYIPFAETKAWCWQQGARLRWHPQNDNIVLFNDMCNGQYITRVFDVKNRSIIANIRAPLYDIDVTASYGLSLNFSRLQRLRPGYGYNTLPDKTAGQVAPNNEGIFYVDLVCNKKELIISLADLAKEIVDSHADEHYINHISISPDGRKFMFFHIWTLKDDTHWKTRLCVYNLDNCKLSVLEKTDRVSHYDWLGNEGLIVTCWDENWRQYYCTYNIETGEKVVLKDNHLVHDGHPTKLDNEANIISDTYPLKHDMQTLFEYNLDKKCYRPIIAVYSNARLYDEKRCDLHPRVSPSKKYITLDTTCENGVRQILLIKNWRSN